MRTVTFFKPLLAFLCAAVFSATATAADTIPANTRYLASNCANCHGTNGVSGSAMPSLAGLKEEYFIAQMQAFKTDKRPATIMHQISKGYSDEQIKVLAAYFAAQKQ